MLVLVLLESARSGGHGRYVFEACCSIRLRRAPQDVHSLWIAICFFFFQAEDGIRDDLVTGVQTCALPISMVCLEDAGNAKDFSCVYHAWTYSLQGDLLGVAFRDGINGQGGMKEDFCLGDHGLRKLRVATLHGLVFGSFSDDVPPLDEYLGEEIVERIARVLENL